ncbi:MAG: hypothetical protein AB8H47_05640 [Bacteroidia bacterium]
MLRTNGLFSFLALLFFLSSTQLSAQDSTERIRPYYIYSQWAFGKGNQLDARFPDYSVNLGVGWKMKNAPFRLGIGFTTVRAISHVVGNHRKLNGIGLQGGYMGKRLALQAEVGRMLKYEEGFSDVSGYSFQQDGSKGTYFRLSPIIRIKPFLAIHFSWYETTSVEGLLQTYQQQPPYTEVGRDTRFLRSFQAGLSFWL